MIAESTGLAQMEEPVVSTGTEDSTLQTFTAEPSTVKSVPAVVVSEATTITVPEVPVTTSALIEPVASVISAPSEMAPASTDIVCTIIERGSGSASTELALTMDIIEELAHQMVQQFFTSMKSCIELVFLGKSSFEFSRMLLKN